jgi:ATP-dependent Lon protease
MATIQNSPRSLPQKPSQEYLRKQAKRLARNDAMRLAAAQRRLAHDYGYRNWAALMTAVQMMSAASGSGAAGPSQPSGLPPTRAASGNVFPFLPLRGLIAFPHVSYPIFVGRATSIKAVQHAQDRQVPIILVAQRDPITAYPSSSEMYEVGTLARVTLAMRLPDGTIKTVIETKGRARVSRFVFDEEFTKAEAEEIVEPAVSDPRLESLVPLVISALISKRAKTFGEGQPEAWSVSATTTDGASMLADRIASELQMDLAWKQALLELLNPADRLEKLLAYLNAST